MVPKLQPGNAIAEALPQEISMEAEPPILHSLPETRNERDKKRDTSFTSADLRGADLTDANLENACLKDPNLAGAILDNANLSGAMMPDGTIHE